MKRSIIDGFCKRRGEKITFKVFEIQLALELNFLIRYIVRIDFIFLKKDFSYNFSYTCYYYFIHLSTYHLI